MPPLTPDQTTLALALLKEPTWFHLDRAVAASGLPEPFVLGTLLLWECRGVIKTVGTHSGCYYKLDHESSDFGEWLRTVRVATGTPIQDMTVRA